MWYNKAINKECHRIGTQERGAGNASVRVPYRGGCGSRAVTAHPLRYARVGASIARPRNNRPRHGTRRSDCAPGWDCEFASACCIYFVFTADGQWPPLHTENRPLCLRGTIAPSMEHARRDCAPAPICSPLRSGLRRWKTQGPSRPVRGCVFFLVWYLASAIFFAHPFFKCSILEE